jgi:hypothetical protein
MTIHVDNCLLSFRTCLQSINVYCSLSHSWDTVYCAQYLRVFLHVILYADLLHVLTIWMHTQGIWKFTQSILKYLLMAGIQYNLTGLINRVFLWLYKSPKWSYHVATCSCQSVRCLPKLKCKDVIFTSVMNAHCQTLHGRSFFFNLPGWVWEYISQFSCAKQINNILPGEPFPQQRKCAKQNLFWFTFSVKWQ